MFALSLSSQVNLNHHVRIFSCKGDAETLALEDRETNLVGLRLCISNKCKYGALALVIDDNLCFPRA